MKFATVALLAATANGQTCTVNVKGFKDAGCTDYTGAQYDYNGPVNLNQCVGGMSGVGFNKYTKCDASGMHIKWWRADGSCSQAIQQNINHSMEGSLPQGGCGFWGYVGN